MRQIRTLSFLPGSASPGAARRFHGVIRLVMAAGSVAVVFCLVLALVALVASLDSGPRLAGVASTRTLSTATAPAREPAAGRTGPGSSRPGGGHRAPGSRVIARYHGAGPATMGPFRVTRPGTFGVAWSYACRGRRPGNFSVGETGGGPDGALDVSVSGPGGHGISWVPRDPGLHALVVVSDCRWTIRVVLPRR